MMVLYHHNKNMIFENIYSLALQEVLVRPQMYHHFVKFKLVNCLVKVTCVLPTLAIPCPIPFAKYTKEILKNTKEKSGNRIFQFLALKTIIYVI